jgi:predicted small lipoprotein YifL
MSLSLSFCFFCLLISLSACGNKGPLYLPDQAVAKKPAATTDQASQKQQIEKKQ